MQRNQGTGACLLLISLCGLSSCNWHSNDAIGSEIPKQVHVHGTVTTADDDSNIVILQTAQGGFRIEHPSNFPSVGQVVDVEGLLSISSTGQNLLRARIHPSSQKGYVRAARISPLALTSAENQFRKVELTGIVRASRLTRNGRLTLVMRFGEWNVQARVINDLGIHGEQLVDAEISATGVIDISYDASGQPIEVVLWISAPSDIRTIQPPPSIQAKPLRSVASLYQIAPEEVPTHRIRLHGRFKPEPKSTLPRFEDETGTIPIGNTLLSSVPADGNPVDLLAFMGFDQGRPVLSSVTVIEQQHSLPVAQRAAHLILRDAATIHRLPGPEATRGYRVELETTITFVDPAFGLIFVQDRGPGIYVDGHSTDFTHLHVGEHIQLKGLTAPGEFAPMIVNPEFTIKSDGPLPTPVASQEQIFTGSLDSSRVELEGVIKAAQIARGHTIYELRQGTHKFEADLPYEVKNFERLINARVRVTGVAGTQANSHRQFLGVLLFVPDISDIKILRQGPSSARMPTQPISALMQFAPDVDTDDPVKVSGIVTYSQRASMIYVQDATGGVGIETRDETALVAGDLVEAVGYARPGNFTAAMENGHFTKLGRASQPEPLAVAANEALSGDFDSELIRIQGILLDRLVDSSRQTLVLSAGSVVFRAYTDELSALSGLRKGSTVDVTGICSVEVETANGIVVPKSFSVLLRSPRDVTLVRKASWWSLEHTLELAATLASFALVAIVWIAALRRQVRLKTKALARRSEELMRAKEAAESASRLKSEFLANMSHEIRTPMNGVLGMTSLALSSEISGEVREYLTMAQDSAQNLLGLLNDVLDLSKIEARRLTLEQIPFSLRGVVTRAVRTLAVKAYEKGLELIIDIDATLPDLLTGDPHRLRQVLLNLLGNAIKFTEQGEVALSVSLYSSDQTSVSLRFVVRDSGIGIDPKQHQAIFESFTQADGSTTRRFGGTGLGLSICQELVRMMSGTIGLESSPGIGSSFWFTARFCLTEEQPLVVHPANSETLRGKPVLIVDDNETNRALLDQIAQRWGMHPATAGDANLALTLSEAACRSGEPFCLYLVDVHMPGRDGFEFVADLRAKKLACDSTILMLSSVDLRHTAERSKELGISSYLLKPTTAEDLLEAVLLAVGGAAPNSDTKQTTQPEYLLEETPREVLLAEDNLVNQKLTKILLEKAGYRVTTVINGIDAFEQVRNKDYDLVLMDVQMPDMDGYEAVQKIREWETSMRRRRVPVIALTAHAMDGDRERCLSAGMDDYVSKPLDKAQLFTKMSDLLAETTPQN